MATKIELAWALPKTSGRINMAIWDAFPFLQ